MFVGWKTDRPDVAALANIEDLVRHRYALSASDLVIVSEDRSRQPGVPETAVTALFWADGARHRLRVFKPARDVIERDLPEPWLRGALIDDGEADCC